VAVPLLLAAPSLGYVDLAPTLARIITDSTRISVVEVAEFDRAAHLLTLKEVRALKGNASKDPVRQDVAPADGGAVPRQVVSWATPGSRGVLFASRTTSLVCTGEGWYQVRAVTPSTKPATNAGAPRAAWKLGVDRPDLPLSYYGSVSRLTAAVDRLLHNQEAVITVVAYGADDQGASFDLALNRQNLPGSVRVQRILANVNMPASVAAASGNPLYFIDAGVVSESDIPSLIGELRAADAGDRAEAAEELRTLGRKARPATEALTALLTDASPRVRFAGAAALLTINPKEKGPVETLAQGLANADATVRRDAARSAGFAGQNASPLVEKLAALLKDPNESVKVTALQSITLLGPVAGKAFGAVAPLLDDPEFAVDAADALGRMRGAASPALKRLAQMLKSDKYAERWAAVRAMSQIGGAEAHPAVDFMISEYKRGPTEVEGYNMMLYLALLGPVAKDAVSTIQSVRIKNGSLPPATMWAIAPDKTLPWVDGPTRGRARQPDGFGPGGSIFGGGNRGFGDLFTLIYEGYVRELGDRLRPAAGVLAQKIIDQKAGEVPAWGYEILASGPEEALAVLLPHLGDATLVARERAIVAIGYMGPAAAAAREKLQAALTKATAEREKRMLEWSLRETEPD